MKEKITKEVRLDNTIVYKNEKGEYHNINDEPAVIWRNGLKQWSKNSKLHRTKGPAVIYSSGYENWWYEGNNITEKVEQLMNEEKINPDWENWTEEDEFLFVLLVS